MPDLAADTRFPQFGPAAVAGGLGAVFTFPLRDGTAGSARSTSIAMRRVISLP